MSLRANVIFLAEEALTPSVLAFDEIVAGPVAAYLKCSKLIGGDVAQHADMAQQGFKYTFYLIILKIFRLLTCDIS